MQDLDGFGNFAKNKRRYGAQQHDRADNQRDLRCQQRPRVWTRLSSYQAPDIWMPAFEQKNDTWTTLLNINMAPMCFRWFSHWKLMETAHFWVSSSLWGYIPSHIKTWFRGIRDCWLDAMAPKLWAGFETHPPLSTSRFLDIWCMMYPPWSKNHWPVLQPIYKPVGGSTQQWSHSSSCFKGTSIRNHDFHRKNSRFRFLQISPKKQAWVGCDNRDFLWIKLIKPQN